MTLDLSRINSSDRSKFNPMSQTFVDQTNEIHKMTLDPDAGGSTYTPHTGSILPVYWPPDRSPGNPDVYSVGGAPNPKTGEKFETHSALSASQFTRQDVENNIMRTAISAHQSGDKTISAGTWHVSNDEGEPEHPRAGQVDLDVSDLHDTEQAALAIADKRGEESIFGNQGARTIHTRHSPKHPKYKKS